MSEAWGRIAEVLGDGGSEEEVAAVLRALGARRDRQGIVRKVPRTPLPSPGASSTVHSEVEWV